MLNCHDGIQSIAVDRQFTRVSPNLVVVRSCEVYACTRKEPRWSEYSCTKRQFVFEEEADGTEP